MCVSVYEHAVCLSHFVCHSFSLPHTNTNTPRHENQRLLRANNGLHVTLINEQEKQDSLDRGWQNKTRDLQNAVNDLKYVAVVYSVCSREREH